MTFPPSAVVADTCVVKKDSFVKNHRAKLPKNPPLKTPLTVAFVKLTTASDSQWIDDAAGSWTCTEAKLPAFSMDHDVGRGVIVGICVRMYLRCQRKIAHVDHNDRYRYRPSHVKPGMISAKIARHDVIHAWIHNRF